MMFVDYVWVWTCECGGEVEDDSDSSGESVHCDDVQCMVVIAKGDSTSEIFDETLQLEGRLSKCSLERML
jgi:hypothetical protein